MLMLMSAVETGQMSAAETGQMSAEDRTDVYLRDVVGHRSLVKAGPLLVHRSTRIELTFPKRRQQCENPQQAPPRSNSFG